MSGPVLYRLPDAAVAVGVSTQILRRALHTTDPAAYPPPLRGRRLGTSPSAPYAIERSELERWASTLPEA